jgi:hypothetical protein
MAGERTLVVVRRKQILNVKDGDYIAGVWWLYRVPPATRKSSILFHEIGYLPADPSEAFMFEFILAHGVDPNSRFGGQSGWRLYSERIVVQPKNYRKHHTVFDCVKAMLRYDASFKQYALAH